MKLLKAEWKVNQQKGEEEFKWYTIWQMMVALLLLKWAAEDREIWRYRERMSKTCCTAEDYWWWWTGSVKNEFNWVQLVSNDDPAEDLEELFSRGHGFSSRVKPRWRRQQIKTLVCFYCTTWVYLVSYSHFTLLQKNSLYISWHIKMPSTVTEMHMMHITSGSMSMLSFSDMISSYQIVIL